jgi:CRP/FNR family cyclic AMP-dependent transcriptional regulator
MLKSLKAGDYIYKAHEKPEGVFLIHTGTVEILSNTGLLLGDLKVGELFGEISELLSERRSVTARAKTNCTLMLIESTALEKKLDSCDAAIKGILRSLALRLKETDKKYEQIWDELQIYKSIKKK